MKKTLISILAVVFSMSAMAVPSALIKLTLTGETGGSNEMTLLEDSPYSTGYDQDFDGENMMSLSNAKSVLLYSYIGATPYQMIYTNVLDGLEISFTTNMDDSQYYIAIDYLMGRTDLVLYDRVAHKSVALDGSVASYPFNAVAGQVEVNGRFVIGVPAAYNVTLNAYGFASFSASESVVVPDGVDAYQAKFVSMNEEVTLTKIAEKIIPANTGVILYGAASANHSLAVLNNGATALPEILLNDLKPSTAWAGATSNAFVLKGDALYEYVGSDFPDNKAYLKLPGGSSAAPKRISFRFNGTTDIDEVQSDNVQCTKFIENGQLLIKRGNAVYNLKGQMVR